MASHRETELKFDCVAEFVVPDFDGLITVSDQQRRLTATYWDTADLRLLGWGVTLRHRSASDSSEEGWTLKLTASSARGDDVPRGAVVRDELTEAGSSDHPPSRLVSLVRAMSLDQPIEPIATIVTDRRALRLGTEFGHALVEIADDDVVSSVGDRAGSRFRQIEVELVEPDGTAAMKAVGRALHSSGLIEAKHHSKLDEVLAPTTGQHHRNHRLDRRSSLAEAIRGLTERSLRQIIRADPAIRLGTDEEAVHRARVATRRLRADLGLFSKVLVADDVTHLRTDLRWFGALLGELRDAQVLAARLETQLVGLTGSTQGAARELLDRAQSKSVFHHTQLQSALGGDRVIEMIRQLHAFALAPPLRPGVRPDRLALPIMEKRAAATRRRSQRMVSGLGLSPTDTELHKVRKQVKRVRYAAEATARLGADSKPIARSARVVQDELGELHDCVVEIAWLAADVDRYSPSAAFVAGRLHEQISERRRELRTGWRTNWDRLSAAK